MILIKDLVILDKTFKAMKFKKNNIEFWSPKVAISKIEKIENQDIYNIYFNDWYAKIINSSIDFERLELEDLIDKSRKPLKEYMNQKSSSYFPEKAMKHQEDCFSWAKDKKCVALFNEMGTGKSKLYIDIANYHFSCGNVKRVYYFAPPTTLDNFRNELKKWQSSNLVWVIYSIHYLATKNMEKINKLLDEINQDDMIVIDESHRIKSLDSLTSKNANLFGGRTDYKIIGTGTASPNYALDLVGQFRFLSPNEWNVSINHLRKKFHNQKIILNDWDKKDILDKTNPYTYSITKQQCLDLPKQVFYPIYVKNEKLIDYYRENIKEVSGDFLKNYEGGIMGFLQNLRKLSTGRNKENEIIVENPKIKALEDVLKDIPENEKVIIWHSFYFEIEDILKVLEPNKTVLLNGEQNTKDKSKAIQSFKEDANIKYLVATASVGGVGLNFTEASYNIYFSRDFDLINRLQSMSRIHRIGQYKQCIYYDLIMDKTIDLKIMKSLENKENFLDKIMKIYKEKGLKQVAEELKNNE